MLLEILEQLSSSCKSQLHLHKSLPISTKLKAMLLLHLQKTKKTLLDWDQLWWTLGSLEAGCFYFHVLQQNSVYNVWTCLSKYETQGEIALVSSTSISPLHRAQRQDRLRDNKMAPKASESTFMLKVIFVPRVVKMLSGQRRRRQDSVHNKTPVFAANTALTKYAIKVVIQFSCLSE